MAVKLLNVKHLGLTYHHHDVLKDVSFEVARGQIVSLIGPNGAGKTSLLKILIGEQAPTSGQVTWEKPVRLGYMPQKLVIDQTLPMTVERFLSLGDRKTPYVVHEVLAEAGLASHWLKASLSHLSGGQLQRVLLAKALLRQPELLILDEPAQGVDVSGQSALYERIRQYVRKHHCAALIVSHDLHWVMAGTDHVICLNQHICCQGQAKRIADSPEFKAMWQGQSNIMAYAHHHDHNHALNGEINP